MLFSAVSGSPSERDIQLSFKVIMAYVSSYRKKKGTELNDLPNQPEVSDDDETYSYPVPAE
ncbi:hypothetical protein IRB23M11_19900 [Alkalibacterium sp. m-11]|uniref:Uncharacterized protein n=1 Tax=Alkalibacterium indicireducens TaxID=398758 RepID=A0ABP3KZA3_9LACT